MAVKIRLKRMGKKKQPIYKVVAADSRSPRDGKFIEELGIYNPLTDPATVNIKEERAIYWLNTGAQPTDTVKTLLSQKGILLKKELSRKKLSEEDIEKKLNDFHEKRELKIAKLAEKKLKSKVKQNKSEDSKSESHAEDKGTASE